MFDFDQKLCYNINRKRERKKKNMKNLEKIYYNLTYN